MSYSFTVRAASKAEALAAVAEKLADVVAQQPAHQIDAPQAQAAVDAFVGLLDVPADRDVVVSVSGSVNTIGTSDGMGVVVTGANVSVGAYLTAREI